LFENSSNREKNLVLGPGESKSFKSICDESSKLANHLRNKSGQDRNVLLLAHNGQFFIVAYLRILKSGNIRVPLNPGIEQNVFEIVKKKTNSPTGFFSEIAINRLRPSDECVTEKLLSDIINAEFEMLEIEPGFDAERIAEIIFISGSTALPKGVMLSHNYIFSNTDSFIRYIGLNESEIMMIILLFFYCYGLSLLHTHIRVSGSLALKNNYIFIGATINDLNKYSCTGFAGVSSNFQIILTKSDLFKNTKFPSLHYIKQAGEKLYNTFISELTETFS
jgi:acyl-CoA synthetase (AMP-forming)/AMP-acid ligase II